MAAPRQLELGRSGDVAFGVALTDQPWDLDVDTLVISVGPNGLGYLGAAVQDHLPSLDWSRLESRPPTPDKPVLLTVKGRQPHLRRVVCAATRSPGDGRSRQVAVREYLPVTVAGAVVAAAQDGARRLAIPLFGAGVGGLPPGDVAPLVVGASLDAVARFRLEEVVFLAHDQEEAEALANAWTTRPQASPPLTASAWNILRVAEGSAGDAPVTPAHVLHAALVRGSSNSYLDVSRSLLLRLAVDGDPAALIGRLAPAVGAAPRPATGASDDLVIQRVAPIVRKAVALPEALGQDPGVHARHLLGAVVTEGLPTEVHTALGTDSETLRAKFLEAVLAALPDEPADRWRQVLGLPAETRASAGVAEGSAVANDVPTKAEPAREPVYSDELAGGISEDLVDADAGIAADADYLDVSTYVGMLATVIARRDTPLPLSVGLFGEWGSGKSYFMGLLRGETRTLSTVDPTVYYPNIVQIGFNAWSYADSNLWASLGDEIFSQLVGAKARDDAENEEAEAADREQARRRIEQLEEKLRGELVRTKDLEAAKVRLDQETESLKRRQQKTEQERDGSLRSLLVLRSAARDETLEKQLDETFQQLGISNELEQGKALAAELSGAPADVRALRAALNGRAVPIAASILLVLLLGGIAAVAFLDDPGRWLSGLSLTALLTVVGGATAVIEQIRGGMRTLTDILRRADKEQLEAKLAAVRDAEERQRALQAQLDEAHQRAGEIDRELAELTPGRRLYSFLAGRADSEDYRQQLGLISTIRRDFEKLAGLMKDWPKDDLANRPIDRIVLYIDDLDRCSARQVVDVLQAVHLLLAMDLFVVVVGVDPRWMLHSLRQQYRDILTADETANGGASGRAGGRPGFDAAPDAPPVWRTTPHDYLEKIFNIPFVLPGMDAHGFDTLIRRLSAVEDHGRPPAPDAAAVAIDANVSVPLEGPHPEVEAGEGHEPSAAQSPATAATATPEQPPPGIEAEAESEVDVVHQGGTPVPRPLTPSELDLLSALAPLVRSPREAKRLLNLYRMLRSTRNLGDSSAFLGGEGRPGEHQAVALLLGILSASPRLLGRLLSTPVAPGVAGGLCTRSDLDVTWQTAAKGLQPRQLGDRWVNDVCDDLSEEDRREWESLLARCTPATALVTLPTLDPFRSWGAHIARFSFVLSPLAATAPPPADAIQTGTRNRQPIA